MNKVKYQIFISSTYSDLKDERDQVIKACLEMGHIPVGMEMFSAADEEQWQIITRQIDESDYYVLILANRYGSTVEGISYTEKEYDYAVAKGVPVLGFVLDASAAWPSDRSETGDAVRNKLDAFRQKVKRKPVNFWTSKEDLHGKCAVALMKTFNTQPRPGWVRADTATSSQTLEEFAIISKENRDLKEQLLHLQTSKKVPLIKVLLNKEESVTLKLAHRYNKPLLTRATYEYPDALDHLAYTFYTKKAVDRFNNWFDSNSETVTFYNQAVEKFERTKASAQKVVIGFKNIGKSKANDINATITFPDSILLDSIKTGLMDMDWPYPAGTPRHPLLIAQEAYNEQQETVATTKKKVYADQRNAVPVHSLYDSIKIDNNTISLSLKSLLHTQTHLINTDELVFLLPAEAGSFKANVEVICEEYAEADEYEIPIEILPALKPLFE